MRFHPSVSAVAAIAVLTATTFHGATPSADAHVAGGGITIQGHHFKTPPPPTPKATPVDNVRDFGAVGNGIIDDTNAIQNAANDAANKHIGLFFPPGTYLHANAVVFNGISVTGSGSASQLVSNNQNNCAVVLTGFSPSIQNMVISTQSLTGGTSIATPNTATLLITSATSFTAANLTIVSGTNIWGALVLQSTVGSVNSCVFDGTGHVNDFGVTIDQGDNVSVTNSLFQNVAIGVLVAAVGGPSQFIAVVSNTLGNVTFPINEFGVQAQGVDVLAISQNTMQMLNSTGTAPVVLSTCNNFAVVGNNTFGGFFGVDVVSAGPGFNVITQNVMHNCGTEGVIASNLATSAIQITGNAFGECGLTGAAAVIIVQGAGADASGATTFIQNNAYQGHTNQLVFYIDCTFTVPHIPTANVTGNTQSQTSLPNHI